MSETAPESTGGGGGNVFTRKIGPLPMWGWMAVVLLLAVGFYLFNKNKSANSATQSTATNNTPGGVDSSLVPQFVNQVYANTTPPPAPNVTVNNTVPTGEGDGDHGGGGDNGGGGGGGGTPPPVHTPHTPAHEVLTQGHVINPNAKKATIGWASSGVGAMGATQLKVSLNGPGKKNQIRYIPATATTATFDNLEKGHTYVAEVTPIDSTGQAVGGPNHITFVTSK